MLWLVDNDFDIRLTRLRILDSLILGSFTMLQRDKILVQLLFLEYALPLELARITDSGEPNLVFLLSVDGATPFASLLAVL